jgi:hypothetical protein
MMHGPINLRFYNVLYKDKFNFGMDLMSVAVALSGSKLWLTSVCRHKEVYFIINDCTVWEIQRVDGHSLYTII